MKTRNSYVIFGLGVIGEAIFKKLPDFTTDFRIFAFDHSRIDITKREQIRPILQYVKPSIVINCAGISDMDICENAKGGSHDVNTIAPGLIAEECEKVKAKLVHMSSYQVYGENKAEKILTERSKCMPINVLGKNKHDAEWLIRDATDNHIIIRMGQIFSENRSNILTDSVYQVERGLNYCITENTKISPIYSFDLVDAMLNLIDKEATGTFNVANTGSTTISEFVDLALSLCSLNLKKKVLVSALSKSFSAPRPKNIVLSCEKYKSIVGQDLRPWEVAIREALGRMHRYKP